MAFVLLALVAILGPVQLPASSVAADRQDHRTHRGDAPTVTITDTPRDVPPVARAIVGGNLRWFGSADGAWDAKHHKVRDDVARLVRKVGLGAIRYPGGTVANLFNPSHAEGKPGCQTSGGLLRPLFAPIPASASQYTIARHAQFAKAAHATTNVMVPMINTPVDAAVDYVKKIASATGQKQIYVELGNEPFNKAQRYWRAKALSERLEDYISGGQVRPDGEPGDHGLYKVTGCNLRKPVEGDGSPNQTYRPRYTPISLSTKPRVWVNGREWKYVPALGGGLLGANEFTVSPDHDRVVFGSGGLLGGGKPPRHSTLKISYTAGPMPGFKDYYQALKAIPGLDVQICSSWATDSFIRRMEQLGLPYDCLAVHSYANIGGPTGIQRMFTTLMKAATKQNNRLAYLRSEMRSSSRPGAAGRYLNVTEFGGQHRDKGGPSTATFMRELVQAMVLVGQVNQGVQVSDLSNFRSLLEMYGDKPALSGRAYVLDYVHHLVGQQPVQVTGEPSDLTIAATRAGAKTSMLVVNHAWKADHKVAIDITGHPATTCVGVRTLRTDPDTLTRPRSVHSRPVSVRRPTHQVWKGDGTLKHTFPSHSITLLTFSPKVGGSCPAVGAL
ncbi:hypothetical protein GCM10022242_07320 [Nocardioides panacisoli]|uniref:Alpha-L-arabinofuranosidase C-terminal domain-containing protein n=2 Tax=Nocardioides panacisoli TaxID=627624 RepID=A0ABP7HXQ4_9ACTN